MEWKNGIKMTKEEEKQVKMLRFAGCKCEIPLLGYIPGQGPRCRMCGIEYFENKKSYDEIGELDNGLVEINKRNYNLGDYYMKINELKDVIKKIDKSKQTIATERDKIQKAYDEIGDILESVTTGIDGLDDALTEINIAIESISEVV